MQLGTAKSLLRSAIAAPGVRHGLRWFLAQSAVPARWRSLVHRKVAKRARFPADATFTHVTPEGTTLRLLHAGTTNYLYWLHEYEPSTTTLFCRLARDASVILDIGAADGIYALLAASANPAARILAFEPGAAAAAVCTRNLELNLPTTRHVELHAIALGERDERATLYVAGETGGTSSLDPAFREVRREQPVVVRRGDSFLAEHGVESIDLIKIDTESTEPAVLRGFREALARWRPDIICEVLPGRTEAALEDLLGPLGYAFYRLTAAGPVRCASLEADPTYREPNFWFTARSR